MKTQKNDEIKNEDIKKAQEVIEKSALRGSKFFSGQVDDIVKEETLPRVERMVETAHRIARVDKEKAVIRLQMRLDRMARQRKIVRRCIITVGSVASVVALWFGLQILVSSPAKPVVPPLSINVAEIKVPTLIRMRDNNVVLSFDSLEIKDADNLYVVKKEIKVHGEEERGQIAEQSGSIHYNRIVVPAGYTYKVLLSDSSSVTLNAGSELGFPEKFRDSTREVELKGEGYFEIKTTEIPFVVKAGETKVEVYGTRFNLFYNEELALAEAVLVEGRIGMSAGGRETKIVPGQRVYYMMKDSVIRTEDVDPADYISWLHNSFKYNRVRLDRIVFDIASWYGVEIHLSPALGEHTYSLEFDKSSSVDWVIQALGMLIDKPIREEGGAYFID